MSSSCNLNIRKLREKNRLLLEQLESNSISLESRLKKLKHTTRTTKLSNKTRKHQSHTPLKRKHEPWRTRNYPGQVPTAVNATSYNCSGTGSKTLEVGSKVKQRTEDTSPAKRSKQNVLRSKYKSIKLCEICKNPFKSSTVTESKNDIYDCADDSDELASKEEICVDLSSRKEQKSFSPVQCRSHSCRCRKNSEPVEKTEILDNEQQRRTLEAAHSLINYSPQSVFLQRLKKRSQALGDLTASGNLRIMSKPSSAVVCKESPHPVKKVVNSNFKKNTKGLCERQICGRSLHSSKSDIENDESMKPSSVHIQHNVKDDLFLCGPKKNENRKPKKIKKRTCYRRYCYCRTPQNIEVEKSYTNVLKENIKESKKDLSDLKNSPSGCCKCREEINSRTSLCTIVVSDQEKYEEDKSVHPQCCSRGSSHWFEELSEFRQSHWFDCHAHPHGSDVSPDPVRNLKKGVGCPSDHKCIHKFALDDRLFAKPLNADHHSNSCCITCNLAGSESRLGIRESSAITLPSRLQCSEVQVSIPAKSFCGSQQCPAVLFQKEGKSHCSTRAKSQSSQVTENLKPRMPPPTDSLALRFQKGIVK